MDQQAGAKAANAAGVARCRDRQQTLGSQAKLIIDRVTASRLGITPQAIDNVLYDAFGQRQIATLFTQLNQYHLVLEAFPDFQKDPAKLNDLYVKSNSGGAVPLSAFIGISSHGKARTVNSVRSPRPIWRSGMLPHRSSVIPEAILSIAKRRSDRTAKAVIAMGHDGSSFSEFPGRAALVQLDVGL